MASQVQHFLNAVKNDGCFDLPSNDFDRMFGNGFDPLLLIKSQETRLMMIAIITDRFKEEGVALPWDFSFDHSDHTYTAYAHDGNKCLSRVYKIVIRGVSGKVLLTILKMKDGIR